MRLSPLCDWHVAYISVTSLPELSREENERTNIEQILLNEQMGHEHVFSRNKNRCSRYIYAPIKSSQYLNMNVIRQLSASAHSKIRFMLIGPCRPKSILNRLCSRTFFLIRFTLELSGTLTPRYFPCSLDIPLYNAKVVGSNPADPLFFRCLLSSLHLKLKIKRFF